MKKLFFSCACTLCLVGAPVYAADAADTQATEAVEQRGRQVPSEVSDRIVFLWGGNAANSELIGMFYDTRQLHFQDPRAPRFLFVDRKGKVLEFSV